MKSIFVIIALFFSSEFAFGQCRVSGIVTDSASGLPVYLVKAEIQSLEITAFTSGSGEFSFSGLKPGVYTIEFRKENYLNRDISLNLTDTSTEYKLLVFLLPFESVTDTIDVRGKYFKKSAEVNTSHVNAAYEEIRKEPGAVEDIVRYFESAPGVSVGSDVENALIVRGGAPVENMTVIDGIELQNPNHFGPPGSTVGLLSYINLKMVDNVDFFTGGFPARFGDKLSSVMDIHLRDGSREKQINDINVSATGFGGFFEGPVTSKSAYMLSVRRSYLELIKHQLNTGILPEYWDANLKLNYDISKSDKISFTGLFAIDDAKPFEAGNFEDDTLHSKILSGGFNFIRTNNYSQLRLTAGYSWNYSNINYGGTLFNLSDNEIFLNQDYTHKFNKKLNLELFGTLKYFFSKYELNNPGGVNSSGLSEPGAVFNSDFETYKINAGFNISPVFFGGKLTLNAGARLDGFGMIKNKFCISPRLGLSYKITPSSIINANAGIYCQSPEMLWILVDDHNKELDFIRVWEVILGFEQYISNDIKFSVEPYLKQYYNYPVNLYNPYFIYINSGVEIYSDFLNRALSSGKGYYFGLDASFQKKNSSKGFYWLLNVSFSRSEFYALIGDKQPAEFDPQKQLTAIAGYRFGFGLSISSRFRYAGGTPYTPFDTLASTHLKYGIYNTSMYNKLRMPDYARLDLRIDYQTLIGKNLLTVYLDIINLLNRENYYDYYWSSLHKNIQYDLQLPRVPALGASFRF